MPYNIFKEVKIKCNVCNDIVLSTSETEWSECSCGTMKVMGIHSFIRISGTKYTDMSVYNFDDLPPHQ